MLLFFFVATAQTEPRKQQDNDNERRRLAKRMFGAWHTRRVAVRSVPPPTVDETRMFVLRFPIRPLQ
jgi:hypothetical protein